MQAVWIATVCFSLWLSLTSAAYLRVPVLFNGASAGVTTWSPTSITTTVPTGATTGGVTVYASGVFSNALNFTVIQPPTISALFPSAGPPGGTVAIRGLNFGADSTVTVN